MSVASRVERDQLPVEHDVGRQLHGWCRATSRVRISHPAVLALLAAHPTPEALRAAGRRRLARIVLPLAPRMGERLLDELLPALAAQTVVIPGTVASGRGLAGVARSLSSALTERRALTEELEDRLDAHPLGEVLTSMPGVGVRTAVKILTIVGDGTAFASAAHLASYAGLAPVTRRSGSSIRGETRSQRGHRALKSALFLSAFASLSDPAGRAYYDRKRKEGKRHNAALVCLARRRLDVLHAMLRTKTPYVSGGPKLSAGTLGNRFGRKRMFVLGTAVLMAGSLTSVFAHATAAVVVGQLVGGIGGAFILPNSLAILGVSFPNARRTEVVTAWAAASGVGLALGPLVAGVLLDHFNWHVVFLSSTVLGAVTIALSWARCRSRARPGSASTSPVRSSPSRASGASSTPSSRAVTTATQAAGSSSPGSSPPSRSSASSSWTAGPPHPCWIWDCSGHGPSAP